MYEKNLFHVNGARWRWRKVKKNHHSTTSFACTNNIFFYSRNIKWVDLHESSRSSYNAVFHSIFGRSTLFFTSLFQFVRKSGFTPNRHSSFLFSLQLLFTCIWYCVCVCMCNALWMYLFNSGESHFQESDCQKKHWFHVFFAIIFAFYSLCTHNANQTKQKEREKELHTYVWCVYNILADMLLNE